ncbi:hypothetical protein AAVH_38556, partial [Aphelenchoides avenae]
DVSSDRQRLERQLAACQQELLEVRNTVTRQQNEIREQCRVNEQMRSIFANLMEKQRSRLTANDAEDKLSRELEHVIRKITHMNQRLQQFL